MGVCEPGQGGNAAAINNTFMCLGEPPRLSRTPAWDWSSARITCSPSRGMTEHANVAVRRESKKRSSPKTVAPELAAGEPVLISSSQPPPAQASVETALPEKVEAVERPSRPARPHLLTQSSLAATGHSGSMTSWARTTWSSRSKTPSG